MVTLVGERRPDLGFGQVQVQLPAFGHDFAERTIDALGHRVGVCRERTALPWPQKSARSSAARNPSACIASISSGSSRKPVGGELRHTAKVVTGDRQVHLPGAALKDE